MKKFLKHINILVVIVMILSVFSGDAYAAVTKEQGRSYIKTAIRATGDMGKKSEAELDLLADFYTDEVYKWDSGQSLSFYEDSGAGATMNYFEYLASGQVNPPFQHSEAELLRKLSTMSSAEINMTNSQGGDINKVLDTEDITKSDLVIASNLGVDRDKNLGTNMEFIINLIYRYAKPVVAFLIFIMVVWAGFYFIIKNQDAKERVVIADRLKYIGIAVILFASLILVITIAYNIQQNSLQKLYNTPGIVGGENQITDIDYDITGNMFASFVYSIIEAIGKLIGIVLEFIINLMMQVVTFGEGSTGDFNLEEVIFFSGHKGTLEQIFNSGNSFLTLAPFSQAEWSRYTVAYNLIAAIAIPLIFIALVKLVIELIIHSGNFEKLTEAKETAVRVVVGILIIVAGPYIFRLILTIFNVLVFLIPVSGESSIGIKGSMSTASGIIPVITTLWWVWLKFQICLAFLVREIMLTVMYVSTPVIVGIWCISNKFRAMQLWIGETLTNASTQFCYALVLYIGTIILHREQSALISLLWFSMVLKLADFFKDSLQGLFQKWGGIDETGVATSFAGTLKGVAGRVVKDTSKGVSKMTGFDKYVKESNVGRNLHNAAQVGLMLTGQGGGDFMRKTDQLKNQERDEREKANEAMQEARTYNDQVDAIITDPSNGAAKRYHDLLRQDREGTLSDVERDEMKNLKMANANDANFNILDSHHGALSRSKEHLGNSNALHGYRKGLEKDSAVGGNFTKEIDEDENARIRAAKSYVAQRNEGEAAQRNPGERVQVTQSSVTSYVIGGGNGTVPTGGRSGSTSTSTGGTSYQPQTPADQTKQREEQEKMRVEINKKMGDINQEVRIAMDKVEVQRESKGMVSDDVLKQHTENTTQHTETALTSIRKILADDSSGKLEREVGVGLRDDDRKLLERQAKELNRIREINGAAVIEVKTEQSQSTTTTAQTGSSSDWEEQKKQGIKRIELKAKPNIDK